MQANTCMSTRRPGTLESQPMPDMAGASNRNRCDCERKRPTDGWAADCCLSPAAARAGYSKGRGEGCTPPENVSSNPAARTSAANSSGLA